jgi:hypothetical protein
MQEAWRETFEFLRVQREEGAEEKRIKCQQDQREKVGQEVPVYQGYHQQSFGLREY